MVYANMLVGNILWRESIFRAFQHRCIVLLLTTMCVHSCVWLPATPWTVACWASLSIGFSRQGYQSGSPFPSPRDLPDPGIEPTSLVSPASADGFFTTRAILHKPSKNTQKKCSFEKQVLMEFEKDSLFPWQDKVHTCLN